MSDPMALLRARQKRIALQRRQLELELEAAQLEEEIMMSKNNQEHDSFSSTSPGEHEVQNAETATVISDTRGGGQGEERMFSTNTQGKDRVRNREPDDAQMPTPKFCTETSETVGDIVFNIGDHTASRSIPSFERSQVERSQVERSTPLTVKSTPKSLESDADMNVLLVNKQPDYSRSGDHPRSPTFVRTPPQIAFSRSQHETRHDTDTSMNTGGLATQEVSPLSNKRARSLSFFGSAVRHTQSNTEQHSIKQARNVPTLPSATGTFTHPDQSLGLPFPRLHYAQKQSRLPPSLRDLPNQATQPLDGTGNSHHVRNWHNRQPSSRGGNIQSGEAQPYTLGSEQPMDQDARPQVEGHMEACAKDSEDKSTEASQSFFVTPSPRQKDVSSPKDFQAPHDGSQVSRQAQGLGLGLGNCVLKRRIVLPVQAKGSVSQASEAGQAEHSQSVSALSSHETNASRKRSSSITIIDTHPMKRRTAEHARAVTPPLNESGVQKMRKDDTAQRPATAHRQQQKPQSRSPSGSQYSYHSSETSSIDSNSDPEDSVQPGSLKMVQSRMPKTNMQQRIVPRITPQSYTLHLQGRSHAYSINPLIHPTVSSVPHPVRQPVNARAENTARPVNRQQIRQRSGALPMLASSSQEPLYRRLTATERSELELRYCAHLARLLCDNTCVSSPPLPLCDETLWSRLRRRFPAQEGRSIPPRYDPTEVYANAADFEVDVKAMLRQYVVLGHCGEQTQNQGHGRMTRVNRCEFEKTGNARVMCWRMRLESILDEKLRQLKPVLRECEESYEWDDMDGKRACIDATFAGVTLAD